MMAEVKNKTGKTFPKETNHWRLGLIRSLSDPAQKILEDDKIVVIKDLYPKATYHFLVCPKKHIANLKSLKSEHLPLLKHMERIAEQIAEKYNERFLIGFHAIPSLIRLHLHVISDDFNSKYLRTKKHWNSFNTEYFFPISVFIKQFEEGKLKHITLSKREELLNKPLKCHKCNYYPKTMPDLKNHLLKHC